MHKILLFAAAAVLFTTSVSCEKIGGNDEKNNPYKSLELSTKSAEFVQKGSSFSVEYIDRINDVTPGSYIISPLSMQFLLGMLLNGAQGETADEITKVLGYGAGEVGAVNEFCLSMLQQLPALDKQTKLTIANAIFVDDGWPLKETFKTNVGRYYQAEVSNLDFADGAGSLNTINGWCSDHTNKLIPKVLDNVSTDILAYLLNALYFKSEWKEKFNEASTGEDPFTDESGNKFTVKMMKQDKQHGYSENAICQIVQLSYGNGAFSMYALLPTKGHTVSDVTEYLKTNGVDAVCRSVVSCDVDLWLPKFETKFRIRLNDILSAMGMPTAFNPAKADFLAMSAAARNLSFVQQDAVIKVDEEGSEAAAVSTAAIEKNTAFLGENAVFHADHPFLYLIVEQSSGAVLFAGKYTGK